MRIDAGLLAVAVLGATGAAVHVLVHLGQTKAVLAAQ